MSNQIILGIEKFNSGQDFKTEILRFSSGSSHIIQNQGASSSAQRQSVTDVTVTRAVDKFSSLFLNAAMNGKMFPKATIKINAWREGKSFIYTFNQVLLSGITHKDGGQSEDVQISFNDYSVKEEAPSKEIISYNQKPKTKKRK